MATETRTAFNKKFAAERRKRIKAGKPGDGGVFTFRGKKYTTDYAKTKKTAAPKKKEEKEEYWNPTAGEKKSIIAPYGSKRRKTAANTTKGGHAKFTWMINEKDDESMGTIKKKHWTNSKKKKLGGFRDDFLLPPIPEL